MIRKTCYGWLVFLSVAVVSGASSLALGADPETVGPANLPSVPAASMPTTLPTTITSTSKDGVEESRTIAGGVEDILEFDFPPRYTVGNKALLDVKEGNVPGQIRVLPIKPGVSSLTVIDPQGKIRKKIVYSIVKTDLSQKVAAIRELLFDVEGVTVKSLDDKIVIDGELIVPRDLDRILLVQQAFPEVLNLVTLSKLSRDAIARRMQKEINEDPGGVNVTVRLVNDAFFLMGKVDSDPDRTRAQNIAETFLPEIIGSVATKEGALLPGVKKVAIRNMIYVEASPAPPAPKLVRVTFHFVEMSKEFLQSSLFKWNPFYTNTAGLKFGVDSVKGQLHTSGGDSLTGTISNLLPKLESGANSGFARVLHSTVGVGIDGQKITLRREDQFPYIAAVEQGVPVTNYAKATLSTEVVPTIVGDNEVQLSTVFTFGVPLGGAGGGSAPAIKTTSMNNIIRVKSGDSAALGGLISNDMAKTVNRDPNQAASGGGTSLFNILRSKQFRNDKSQFVVFITPQVIEDAAQGTADIKRKFINNKRKRLRPIN